MRLEGAAARGNCCEGIDHILIARRILEVGALIRRTPAGLSNVFFTPLARLLGCQRAREQSVEGNLFIESECRSCSKSTYQEHAAYRSNTFFKGNRSSAVPSLNLQGRNTPKVFHRGGFKFHDKAYRETKRALPASVHFSFLLPNTTTHLGGRSHPFPFAPSFHQSNRPLQGPFSPQQS